MRILALDVGDRRIGLAVSDELEVLATPYGVLERKSKAEDAARIARLTKEENIGLVVVGLPLSSDGSLSAQARKIQKYALSLEQALGCPVVLFDESYSTAEAQELLTEAQARGKVLVDAAAAAVILRDFLQERRPNRP